MKKMEDRKSKKVKERTRRKNLNNKNEESLAITRQETSMTTTACC